MAGLLADEGLADAFPDATLCIFRLAPQGAACPIPSIRHMCDLTTCVCQALQLVCKLSICCKLTCKSCDPSIIPRMFEVPVHGPMCPSSVKRSSACHSFIAVASKQRRQHADYHRFHSPVSGKVRSASVSLTASPSTSPAHEWAEQLQQNHILIVSNDKESGELSGGDLHCLAHEPSMCPLRHRNLARRRPGLLTIELSLCAGRSRL